MPNRWKILDQPERFCEALEAPLRNMLADNISDDRLSHLDIAVERAAAAAYRVLVQSTENEHWLYFRIDVVAQKAHHLVAQKIVPMLQDLKQSISILGWWWLSKTDICGSAVRLRVEAAYDMSAEMEQEVVVRLRNLGCNFQRLRYEPEVCLFGGPVGIRLAHAYFFAECEFLASWMQRSLGKPFALPEGLSLAIVLRTLRAAGLDLFERWDVFDRISAKRLLHSASNSEQFQALAYKIIHSGPDRVFELYEGHTNLLQTYGRTLDILGQEIARASCEGRLECGLREFLVPVLLFHWNRIGLPYLFQSGISAAVAKELAALCRAGTVRSELEKHGTSNT